MHSFGIGTGSARAADTVAAARRYCGLERAEEIDRMAALVAGGGDRLQLVGQRLHRAQPGVLRRRRKRPGVAERHRSEAPRLPRRRRRAHAAVDVQERDAIDRAPAELIRRAVAELLELVIDLDDADVGGAGDDDRRRRAGPERGRGDSAARDERQHRRGTRWREEALAAR